VNSQTATYEQTTTGGEATTSGLQELSTMGMVAEKKATPILAPKGWYLTGYRRVN